VAAASLGAAACSSPTKDEPADSHLSIEHQYDIASTCGEITLSAHRDAGGRPYLYVAAKDGGLRVYEISGAPVLKKTIPVSALGGLHVMNLSQTGTRLFLALGNTFGTAVQTTGMAIVDVASPVDAAIRSVWLDNALHGGSGIALSDGPRAYLGAMGNGIILFDVTDPEDPRELSRFKPPLDFPDAIPDPTKINARGMEVVGNTMYLAYDAGGLRVIDVSNPSSPREIGRYSNPALNGKPRAYNNVVIDGAVAYVGFDYCGLEVLDVSSPHAPRLITWWNPWACETGPLNWFSSDGHINEIALDREHRLLFAASGKSDLSVLDVSNPAAPTLVLEYGGTENGIGTWGVSIHGDQVFLTYTCALIPFTSFWSGVKILAYRT
jgi:hypothetical protein